MCSLRHVGHCSLAELLQPGAQHVCSAVLLLLAALLLLLVVVVVAGPLGSAGAGAGAVAAVAGAISSSVARTRPAVAQAGRHEVDDDVI